MQKHRTLRPGNSRLRKQAKFCKLRSGFTLTVHLGRLRVSPRDQAVLVCLLVATLLTTGPVVVRLAEMTIYRVREQVVPLLVVCIHACSKVLQVFSVSRFTVNKKDQSELVGSAPGRSTGCRVCRVTVHSQCL